MVMAERAWCIEFSFNGGCKNRKGYMKYVVVMEIDCVWAKTKRGFNSYAIQPLNYY